MHRYPLWKYLLLLFAIAVGALYSAPNLFGEDPSLVVSRDSGDAVTAEFGETVTTLLTDAQLPTLGAELEKGRWVVRFDSAETQLKASDLLKSRLGDRYVVALTLASQTPEWLKTFGARPMALGLDLRGGVHFLIEVDVDDVKKKAIESYVNELPANLRKKDIRYTGRRQLGDAVQLDFADESKLDAARKLITSDYRELTLSSPKDAPLTLEARISEAEAKRIQDFAVQQNLLTLRNRVNQLGVSEPVVQRQGANRILVQLPGVQDPAEAKNILDATATLEYRAVDEGDARSAAATGIVPPGTELYYTREGRFPYLLKKEVIASGAMLVDAAPTIDENGSPAVSVTLDGQGAKRMLDFTTKSVGKPMAVVFKEIKSKTTKNAKGEAIRERQEIQEIISVATIRGVFGKRFQTTGLGSKEAHDLSLLLKAGALAAPVEIVEERTVGPSLGADNIKRGYQAAMLGLALVAAFMIFYYRVFGLFAIAALSLNLLLLVAALSILPTTMSMPGIAGLVLTMGIAVDANVLIYERIREELREGLSPQAAIEAGYDRAFLTIADANVTTIIAAIALIAFGSGPVKGFATVLALGTLTSQFTAIIGSRSLAHLVFERKARLKDLPIW